MRLDGAPLGPLSLRGTWRSFAEEPARTQLAERLGAYAREQRWYRSKAAIPKGAEIEEVCFFDDAAVADHFMVLLALVLEADERETYFMPLRLVPRSDERAAAAGASTGFVTAIEVIAGEPAEVREFDFFDASASPGLADMLLKMFHSRATLPSENGSLSAAFLAELPMGCEALESRFVPFDQSNSTIVYGSSLLLKLLRKVEFGLNVELEVGRFLAGAKPRIKVPEPLGALLMSAETGERTLAVLSELVENRGSAWALTLETVSTFFACILTSEAPQVVPDVPSTHAALCREAVPEGLARLASPYFGLVRLLAERTAELHRGLGRPSTEPGFGQEPLSASYQQSIYESAHAALERGFAQLAERLAGLPESARELARRALDRESTIDQRLRGITTARLDVTRIRCHGDYHLGQVLFTGDDFVIIDFEGEPGRTLSERRSKHSPLRDVAGMLRSFAYAADSALRSDELRIEERQLLRPWAEALAGWLSVAFVRSYLAGIAGESYCPRSPAVARVLLEFFELEKALYEVSYELNNRPEWVEVPLTGLLRILGA